MNLSRRRFLQSGLAIASVGGLPRVLLANTPSPGLDYELIVAPADVNIVAGGTTSLVL